MFIVFEGLSFGEKKDKKIADTSFHPPSRVISVLITCAPESFLILFYIPKVILKFYVDGKLQIT